MTPLDPKKALRDALVMVSQSARSTEIISDGLLRVGLAELFRDRASVAALNAAADEIGGIERKGGRPRKPIDGILADVLTDIGAGIPRAQAVAVGARKVGAATGSSFETARRLINDRLKKLGEKPLVVSRG